MEAGFKLTRTIAVSGCIEPGDCLLLAVSGGPDSVALLHLLIAMRAKLDLQLEVAHVQHGIRGDEAMDDAIFVGDLARSLNLPFHLKELDLPSIKKAAGKGNLEALARAARYQFFSGVVKSRKLTKVVTAHTQDDQAETVLMWFLRGAGTSGLRGIVPVQQFRLPEPESKQAMTIVRPLLGIPKVELLEYLADCGFGFRIDRTNENPAYLRNWLRHELFPAVEKRLDSNIRQRLAAQAQILRGEDEWLEKTAAERLSRIGRTNGLDRWKLAAEPVALQRRMLRQWIASFRGSLRGVGADHIQQLIEFAASDTPQGRLALPGAWECIKEYELVRLEKPKLARGRPCYCYEFLPGETLHIPEAKMTITSALAESVGSRPKSLDEAVFDLDSLGYSLQVRNFRNGDRFRPFGMAGTKKIKDLFIERRLPISQRAVLPLLVSGGTILWIPGCGRSDVAPVTVNSTRILHLKAAPFGT